MATQIVTVDSLSRLRVALSQKFPPGKADEIIDFYKALRREAHIDALDDCLVSGGKFVEAVLKCLHYVRTGDEVDSIKAEEEIKALESAAPSLMSGSERLMIPRALRLIYGLRNKRGGAHNTSFDPLKMDCAMLVAVASWVMEELTRHYLVNDENAAKALIESLLVKDIPLVEEIEGDRLILRPGLSARVQLEILLYREYPKRHPFKDLTRWIHEHSVENIRVTLRTMKQKKLAHETVEGWTLTEAGLREAETEIAKLLNGTGDVQPVIKSRSKGARHARK